MNSTGLSSSGRTNITVASTMSLRPKPFVRNTVTNLGDEKEVFLHNSLKTLHKGTFNEIDLKCQMEKFERFKYKSDSMIKQAEQTQYAQTKAFEDIRRQEMLNKSRILHESNISKDHEITDRWKATQRVKKDRQIRDLQFEMAMLKVAELKDVRSRQVHRKDQVEGVNSFERIMKRSGIGADDSAGGGSAALKVSYEDGEAFIQRLEDTMREKFPTDEEVSNFVTQLKERAQENRVARYEKARRKRRALVDQKAAAAATTASATTTVNR